VGEGGGVGVGWGGGGGGGVRKWTLNFDKILRYELFNVKLYSKPFLHLHHHVGKLHPTSMD